MNADDAPRAMQSAAVRRQRTEMLAEPHIAPLAAYAADLRKREGVEVPDFDPLDGGIDARALFLFEKPGPMTSASPSGRQGSGFISRDNDDPTAEATHGFMKAAGLPRKATAIWNTVPWWNGTRAISRTELQDGAHEVHRLLEMLPQLRAVVLVGQKARRAKPYLVDAGVAIFESDHPSPLVRARWPDRWQAIPLAWGKVAALLGEAEPKAKGKAR